MGLLWLVVPVLPLLAFYLLYLDHVVRVQFEGKRWALPARVYATPLELYAGRSLDAATLEEELLALGYQHGPEGLRRAGTYTRDRNRLYFHSRGFDFWDGPEAGRGVVATFQAGRLGALTGADGEALDVLRLEPVPIAGIYPAHHEDRLLVRRSDLPPLLVQALIITEDRSFPDHHGVDPRGIARAIWANLRAGRAVQGGSTLTQQLVKNFYLSSERTLRRKAVEALMALLLEWHYDKDEILEAYANEIYLGQDGRRAIHGFGLASQFYFGRPLGELAPQHIALLVALVRGPSYYDPRRHDDRALQRRNLVLEQLRDHDLLSEQTAARAIAAPLGLSVQRRGVTPYPAFLDLVRRHLHRHYRPEDLSSEGLQIFTTLERRAQRSAERALAGGLPILERRHGLPAGQLQGAVVLADPRSGEVLAVVGGRQPAAGGFNRALDARRQIGSLIKPFIYLEALSRPQTYNLLSVLADEAVAVAGPDGQPWSPENYDQRYHGPVSLVEALAQSYNAATVNLSLSLGLETLTARLHALGLPRRPPAYPSLALGALELSPLEVLGLYQTLANGGFASEPRSIRAVLTADGQPLNRYPLEIRQVADPAAVYLTDYALQQVVAGGTGRSLQQKLPAQFGIAGKTGTTNDRRDSWFAGFSGNLVGVVWLGRDDNRPAGLTGASGALRIFGDALRGLSLEPLAMVPPGDIELVAIDPVSGGRADERCSGAVVIPFVTGSGPVDPAPCSRGGSRGGNPLRWFLDRFLSE